MGNACAGSRECKSPPPMTTNPTFGMLCRRPIEKPVVVKFENHYIKKTKKSRRRRVPKSETRVR